MAPGAFIDAHRSMKVHPEDIRKIAYLAFQRSRRQALVPLVDVVEGARAGEQLGRRQAC